MFMTFREWLRAKVEMAGGGPYIHGSVDRRKHPDFQVWGDPDSEIRASKKCKKRMWKS